MIELACLLLLSPQTARVEWISGPDRARAGYRALPIRVRVVNTGVEALPHATVEEYYGVKKTTAQVNIGLATAEETGGLLVPVTGSLVTVAVPGGGGLDVELAFDVPPEASGKMIVRVQVVVIQQTPEVKVTPISDEIHHAFEVEGIPFFDRPKSMLAFLAVVQIVFLAAAVTFVVRGIRRRRA